MRYTYRCRTCGHESLREGSMRERPPECMECSTCATPTLMRVWEAPRLNLGYRPHLHDQNEQFKFKNL